MKAYIGIKYHHDCRNRVIIEKISSILEGAGYETSCIIRDIEKWGSVTVTPNELMEITFKEIDSSNVVVIDVTEKGVGLGIESGYAYAKGIPVYIIAKKGSEISNTMLGISKKVLIYEQLEDIETMFNG
ncbi:MULTISPECIES: nucleoside 2-deoxyribosyltransferase [Desulfitobacterium]|uniref:Nucleoside 2-deoxyribosyltransferase n=1 Tax=Desulfitobacterium dehalogenans (strain ATCC 51507 / DSM 9161 / JW/IU-DC1) TaxID=756499 RepID=I4A5T9_DESDJ|nr:MULTISPECIES: nucleoside 2-deoxyribosyltransferase [Desulfitobacterium]AFL99323.1 nucleoside 2-deoxyribosyltransferase [Desulfitobacterium dehalogenans ATCC 51507]